MGLFNYFRTLFLVPYVTFIVIKNIILIHNYNMLLIFCYLYDTQQVKPKNLVLAVETPNST